MRLSHTTNEWTQYSTCRMNFPSYATSLLFNLSFLPLPSLGLSFIIIYQTTISCYMHVTVAAGTIFSSRSYLARRIKFVLMTLVWESLSPTNFILAGCAAHFIGYSCTDVPSESRECKCKFSKAFTKQTMNTTWLICAMVNARSHRDIHLAMFHRSYGNCIMLVTAEMISKEMTFYLITKMAFYRICCHNLKLNHLFLNEDKKGISFMRKKKD